MNTSTTGTTPPAESAGSTGTTGTSPPRRGSSLVAAARATIRRHPRLIISSVLLVLCVLIAFIGPLIYTASSTDGDLFSVRAWPSAAHPLGTDSNGRDTLARLLSGMQVTFLVAALVEFINICLGTAVGLLAGYYRGWIDAALSRLADVLFAFPGLLFVIVLAGIFGTSISESFGGAGRLALTATALALIGWPLMARYVRGVTLSLSQEEFVLAARAVGTSNRGLLWRHILPNVSSLVVVAATLDVVGVVGSEATLSLLGLGIQDPGSSLGLMINEARDYMDLNWTQEFFPCATLVAIVLIFSFLGDGLRNALDPRARRGQ